MTFDTTAADTYSAAFITAQGSVAAAEVALARTAGEIRGFLEPAAVPEPAPLALLLAGAGAPWFTGRRQTVGERIASFRCEVRVCALRALAP